MNDEANAIRREIERTRERLSETVEALAYKADVRSRAREAVGERLETVKETLSIAAGTVREGVVNASEVARDALADAGTIEVPATSRIVARAGGPLLVAAAAFAAGAAVGALVPIRSRADAFPDDEWTPASLA